jgi:hypothetical protein
MGHPGDPAFSLFSLAFKAVSSFKSQPTIESLSTNQYGTQSMFFHKFSGIRVDGRFHLVGGGGMASMSGAVANREGVLPKSRSAGR